MGEAAPTLTVDHRFETEKLPTYLGAPPTPQVDPGGAWFSGAVGDGEPDTEEVVVSRFTDKMFHSAMTSDKGMVTGEPQESVRHTWREVYERARCIAGGLAAAGVGQGDAVGVLAGAPVEIAPTAQALWMRGASLTMLHQPTPAPTLSTGLGTLRT